MPTIKEQSCKLCQRERYGNIKKVCILFLLFVCVIGISACGKQTSSQNVLSSDEKNTTETIQNNEKIWSEQEIISMFHRMNKNGNLEY